MIMMIVNVGYITTIVATIIIIILFEGRDEGGQLLGREGAELRRPVLRELPEAFTCIYIYIYREREIEREIDR